MEYDVLEDMPSGPKLEFTLEETPPSIWRPGIAGIDGIPLGETPSNFKVRTTVSPTITDSRSSELVKAAFAANNGEGPARAKSRQKSQVSLWLRNRLSFCELSIRNLLVLPVCVVWRKFPLGLCTVKNSSRPSNGRNIDNFSAILFGRKFAGIFHPLSTKPE
jgi:hypothetical protein